MKNFYWICLLLVLLRNVVNSLETDAKFYIFKEKYIAYYKVSFQMFTEKNQNVKIFLEVLLLDLANSISERSYPILEKALVKGRFVKSDFYEYKELQGKSEYTALSLQAEANYISTELNCFISNEQNNEVQVVVIASVLPIFGSSGTPTNKSIIKIGKLEMKKYYRIQKTDFNRVIKDLKETREKFRGRKAVLLVGATVLIYWVVASYILFCYPK